MEVTTEGKDNALRVKVEIIGKRRPRKASGFQYDPSSSWMTALIWQMLVHDG